MIMMINIVDLLFVGRRTWLALYHITVMQIFKPIKQKFA